MEEDNAAKGLMIMWAIWNSRNSKVKQGRKIPATLLASQAIDFLDTFLAAQPRNQRQLHGDQEQWTPPQAGVVKIKYDRAINPNTRTGGIGVIIKDSAGTFLGAVQASLLGKTDPFTVEVLAALKAMDFAIEKGYPVIDLEGDALGVVISLNSDMQDLSPLGNVMNVGRMRSKLFQSCNIIHVRRRCNQAAHQLEKDATTIQDYLKPHNCIPQFIANTVSTKCIV
ncbi:hypothetical protein PTKIN_Ptkin15bG0067200 [Pterospermum kingtungense]